MMKIEISVPMGAHSGKISISSFSLPLLFVLQMTRLLASRVGTNSTCAEKKGAINSNKSNKMYI